MTPQDKFIAKATLKFKDKFDYSKVLYTRSDEKVLITCPLHGEFKIAPYTFLNSKMGCQKCSRENMSHKSTTSEFIAKANSKFGDTFDYSLVRYNGSKKKVTIMCQKHGEFQQSPNRHLNSKHGCPKCATNAGSKSCTNTTAEFIAKAKSIHGDNFDYSKTVYKSYKKKVLIICNNCGTTISQTPNSHMNGNGCPACSTSGFNINKPAILYYLSLNDGEAYKIGITNRTVEARFSLTDLKSISVIKTWHFSSGKDALKKESAIKKEYVEYKYTGPDLLTSGNTELFYKDILCLDKRRLMKYLVLDTNIILLDANNICSFEKDTTVVIPSTVVNEIDSKKTGPGELAYQAREFGRLISKGNIQPVKQIADLIITPVILTCGTVVHIASTTHYPDLSGMPSNITNDRKIIEVALQYSKQYSDTVFMSNDIMCRISSIALGLTVTDFKVVDKVDYEFTKTLEVPENTFKTLHNSNIFEVDPNHSIEHYNYKFTTPNSTQIKLASINNETITILGKDSEAELRRQEVNPKGSDQLLLARAIQDPSMDLIVCEALAGSGKTLCSLSNAMRLVKANTPYNSILYIRASINDVEQIEEVGFLKGSAEEKNSVYFYPLYDSLNFMAKQKLGKRKLKGAELEQQIEEYVQKYIDDYGIITLTGLGMRGRTFSDTVVIIDEVQGMSKPSLQKVLTRFGKNCKIILVGSNNQIDNPNMTKYTNGLSVILNDCATQLGGINKHVVPMHKVVRSEFAEYAEKLFSKDT